MRFNGWPPASSYTAHRWRKVVLRNQPRGIQGTSRLQLDRIDRAILAVPGGAWSTMLPRSYVYHPSSSWPTISIQIRWFSWPYLILARPLRTDPINLSEMLKTQDSGLKAKIILKKQWAIARFQTSILGCARQLVLSRWFRCWKRSGLEQTDVIDQGAGAIHRTR